MKKDRARRTAERLVEFGHGVYYSEGGKGGGAREQDIQAIARAIRAETRRCIKASIRINPVLGGISDAVDAIREGAK